MRRWGGSENRRLRGELDRLSARYQGLAENHLRVLLRLELAASREAALFAKLAELEATNAALINGIRVFDGSEAQ